MIILMVAFFSWLIGFGMGIKSHCPNCKTNIEYEESKKIPIWCQLTIIGLLFVIMFMVK